MSGVWELGGQDGQLPTQFFLQTMNYDFYQFSQTDNVTISDKNIQ